MDSTRLLVKGANIDISTQETTIKLQNVTGNEIIIDSVIGIEGYHSCEYTPKIIGANKEFKVVCKIVAEANSGSIEIDFTDYEEISQTVGILDSG